MAKVQIIALSIAGALAVMAPLHSGPPAQSVAPEAAQTSAAGAAQGDDWIADPNNYHLNSDGIAIQNDTDTLHSFKCSWFANKQERDAAALGARQSALERNFPKNNMAFYQAAMQCPF
jgi:hypothetical protein